MSRVLVGVVQAVVVAVANVNSRDAVSVVAREQVAQAGLHLTLAIVLGFVGVVAAVIVSVAVPGCRNAPMRRTSTA